MACVCSTACWVITEPFTGKGATEQTASAKPRQENCRMLKKTPPHRMLCGTPADWSIWTDLKSFLQACAWSAFLVTQTQSDSSSEVLRVQPVSTSTIQNLLQAASSPESVHASPVWFPVLLWFSDDPSRVNGSSVFHWLVQALPLFLVLVL